MGRVLLTDAQQRKTLVAARSLGRKGLEVLAGEETRWALARFSKYCRQGMVYPSPGKKPDDFFHWLMETLRKSSCDVLIPMDDNSIEVIISHREEVEKFCHLPLPATASYLAASDKALSTAAAMEAGLNCPETVIPKNPAEVGALSLKMNFPVIIKPRKSSGSRGIAVAENREELVQKYQQVHEKYSLPIIQEYISPGDKYDVCLLFNRENKLRASFVQKEIRFFPLEKGPSTVQESVLYPELVAEAARLMEKLNWYGVAEVEFMVDGRDGKVKFMEINPRFWGSLYTAELAGIDFPWLLYRLAVEGDVEEVCSYRTGVRCRWLLPGDILHFFANPKRLSMAPPFFSTKRSGVYDDIISWDDPGPILGFMLACIRYLPDKDMWKLMFER